jgi:hypothetical protein
MGAIESISRTPMKRFFPAAAAVALVAIPANSEADETERIKRVTYYSGQASTSELAEGEPVVAFPLRCRDKCDYTIRLVLEPPGGDCSLTLEPWGPECTLPTCIAFVEFGPHLQPVRFPGRPVAPAEPNPDNDPNFDLAHAFLDTATADDLLFFQYVIGSASYRGSDHQMLDVLKAELEIDPISETCDLSLQAVYHPDSNDVYEKGRLLPR